MTNIKYLRVLKLSEFAILPERATPRSAGLDLFSPRDRIVRSNETIRIDLDLQIDIPFGYYGKLESKSGLAFDHSIHVCAGIIDEDYTGNISVVLYNLGRLHHCIKRGDAIAQMIIQPCICPMLMEVVELPQGPRTEGFGALDKLRNFVDPLEKS